MYSVDTTEQFELKKALDISIAEANRGEVNHYESLEDLKKHIG